MGDVNKKRAINKSNYIFERKKSLDSIKELHKINPRNAKKELIRHLEIYPNDMYAKFYYGKLCEEESLFDEAEKLYKEVSLSDSNNRIAGVFGLAEVYRKKGNYELAKKYYYKAIEESDKEQRPSIYNLVRMERIDGNYKKAFALLDMLEIQDSNVEIEKIKILSEQQKYKEAIELAKNIKPENDDQRRILNYNCAKFYAILKKYDLAKELFKQAKKNAPKDLIYHKTLAEEGKMHFELEEYDKAIKNFQEIENNGENLCGEVSYVLGRCYQEVGKYKDAIEKYYEATTTPGVKDSMRGMNLLYLAKLEFIAGFYDKSLNHYKESLEINKITAKDTVPCIINSIIYIDMIMYKYEEALDFINKYKEFDGVSTEQLDLYKLLIRKRNNLINGEKFYRYRERQIVSYSKKDAINHLKNHHGITAHNSFDGITDMKRLFDEVTNLINDNNITLCDGLERHIIKYNNAGLKDGKPVNQINVVVIPGTKNIITMFPDDIKSITREEILQTYDKVEKKENERIKKFNARFNKFNNTKNKSGGLV